MPDSNKVISLSPADFADTGQWRLIIHIGRHRMCAYLKHISDTSKPIAELFDVHFNNQWSKHRNEPEASQLLSKIENIIYDHPGVLDDYATDIIIETPFIAFAPSEILNNEEDSEFEIFSSLFPGRDDNPAIEPLGQFAAIYSLTSGLEDFISRTIPGARLRSHLGVMIEKFRNHTSDTARIYADIRDKELDLITFNTSSFLSASVQAWQTPEDIAYRIFHLMQAYDIPADEVQIHLSGIKETRREVIDLMRKFCNYVVNTTLPSANISPSMPIAVKLLA